MLFWKRRIYADAAAATPLSARAQHELNRLARLYGNPGSLHREAVEAKRELENARKIIATSIGAHAEEIVFTASGTEANNLAIQGVLRPLLRQEGTAHAITSAIEHQSVLEPLRALTRDGLSLTELPVSAEGLVDPKGLHEALTKQTVFVSVQLVNSEIGAIEPVREIAKLLRKNEKKIYFHIDASQAPLWVEIGVEKLGCDFMTLDGQKVMGPKGVGCLYIKRGTPVEPILWGGRQERGLRAGTENLPLIGAFAVALEEAVHGSKERAQKISVVRDYLWSEIKRVLPDAALSGPRGETRVANNLNFSVPGLSGEMAVVALDAEGIAASTRSACDTGGEAPSHVIQALGASENSVKGAIRLTLLPDAARSDATFIAQALERIASRYRQR